MSLIDLKGINWADVKIPEGRTQKACMHVIGKMRQTYKKGGEDAGDADNSNGSSATKITKAKLSPRKRNSPAKRKQLDDFVDDTESSIKDETEEEEGEIDGAVDGKDGSGLNKRQKLARQKQEDKDDIIKAEDVSDIDEEDIGQDLAEG